MPAHHPGPELLMDYASGALPEPVALLVAAHASLCRDCQAEIARLEAVGGTLLSEIEAAPLAEDALDRALARLERPQEAETAPAERCTDARLPKPLRAYLPGEFDHLAWKRRGSVAELDLLPDFPGFQTRLLHIRAGSAIPQHTHDGSEYTLLLAGGFSDAGGHYLRGDVAVADPSVDHRPVADAGEDCLCLAVTDAPLRLSGRFSRYLNFLVRM